jgi:hypothetical protein
VGIRWVDPGGEKSEKGDSRLAADPRGTNDDLRDEAAPAPTAPPAGNLLSLARASTTNILRSASSRIQQETKNDNLASFIAIWCEGMLVVRKPSKGRWLWFVEGANPDEARWCLWLIVQLVVAEIWKY